MRIWSALLTTVVMGFGYFGMLRILELKYALELKKENTKEFLPIVWGMAVITFLLTGVLSYIRFVSMPMVQYFLSVVLICALAVCSITDIQKRLVPNLLLKVLLLLWLVIEGVYVLWNAEAGIALAVSSAAGAAVGGAVFLLCYLLSGKQLGAGDVKLAFAMGLYMTGERIVGGIFYGAVLCCLYCLIQLLRKKLTLKDAVPMVPFLYAGTVVTYFFV